MDNIHLDRGWQEPISCDDHSAVITVACEEWEQRFVPTCIAAGDNEIKQHRDFSLKHFPGVAACRFCLDGQGRNAVRENLTK